VVEPAKTTVRCECGALLEYGVKDVHREPTPPGVLASHMAVINGGWPWIPCPECERAVLVSGVW
jgi:hypothetical protein